MNLAKIQQLVDTLVDDPSVENQKQFMSVMQENYKTYPIYVALAFKQVFSKKIFFNPKEIPSYRETAHGLNKHVLAWRELGGFLDNVWCGLNNQEIYSRTYRRKFTLQDWHGHLARKEARRERYLQEKENNFE